MTSAISNAAGNAGLSAIKARQQAMWASGDSAVIGTTLQIVGESICEAVDLRAGERVIDAAAGNGNASLAAARRFARRSKRICSPSCASRTKVPAAPASSYPVSTWKS